MQSIKNTFRNYTISELLHIFDHKFGLGRLELALASNWINPLKTIWLNFRSFPLCQAWKLPIWVYGRPRLYCLTGSMKVGGSVSSGMIKFNKDKHAGPSLTSAQSVICNYGTIIFRGKGLIGTGTKIVVYHKCTLDLGKNFKITDFCNIGCLKGITIGEQCRIAHRCQILDSNYHYVANFTKRNVKRHGAPIHLGKGCWICNSSTITGGSQLPDFTIVASNSLVNKDFSNIEYSSLIGGIPAKYIATGFRKIENSKIEKEINDFFSNSQKEEFPLDETISRDLYSYVDIFK